MTGKLYIIRHGQTDWNIEHKLQGQTDIPLSNAGRDMARKAGKNSRVNIDLCYSSPLRRALETAELYLGEDRVPIVSDERLMEMSFGIYEGMKDYFTVQDHPVTPLFQDPVHYTRLEGGESFEELYARCESFLREELLPALEEGKSVLVSGHGCMNCALMSLIRGTPLKEHWSNLTGNCVVTELTKDVQRLLKNGKEEHG
ncbi:MAG: histidine phosphatase family protein [Lachnospiraceae bacterium]|nr:histidine phosphatase family protein [Lachnospiraceae bacterium]